MAATHSNEPVNSISGADGGIPSGLFMIDMQEWHKHVELDATPILDGITKSGPAPAVPMDKATWGWSRIRPKTDTVNGAISAAATTVIGVDNSEIYQVGNLIQFTGSNNELARVEEIDNDAGTITVVRGYAGTTAETSIADGSGIFLLAPSFKEYDPYETSSITQGESDYNYHQIMQWSIPFSHRAQEIPTYETREFGNDRAKWAAMQLTESTMPQDLEYALIHQTVRQAGTQSVSGVFGGIRTSSFISTRNTSLGGVPLTPKILLDHIQLMKRASKEPIGKQLICHPNVARYIYSWFHEMRQMDAGSTDKVATYTRKIDTPYGVFEVVPTWTWTKPGATDAEDPLDEILICNLKDYKITPLSSKSSWKMYYREEGDLDYWGTEARMRGDITVRAGNPYTRGLLGGFSVNDADYPAMI